MTDKYEIKQKVTDKGLWKDVNVIFAGGHKPENIK